MRNQCFGCLHGLPSRAGLHFNPQTGESLGCSSALYTAHFFAPLDEGVEELEFEVRYSTANTFREINNSSPSLVDCVLWE